MAGERGEQNGPRAGSKNSAKILINMMIADQCGSSSIHLFSSRIVLIFYE